MLYKIGIGYNLYYKNAAFIYIFLCCVVLSESFWVRLGVLIDIIELRLQADKMYIYYSNCLISLVFYSNINLSQCYYRKMKSFV